MNNIIINVTLCIFFHFKQTYKGIFLHCFCQEAVFKPKLASSRIQNKNKIKSYPATLPISACKQAIFYKANDSA